MKRIALFFTAALLAAPTFAAEDLCTVNLQKLDDRKAAMTTLGSPLKEQVEEHQMEAEKARDAGDLENCGAHAAKALQLIEAPGEDGNTN
ncbi:MAG: hypothetical protein V4812_06705 [Pseudomonadota bacterium]